MIRAIHCIYFAATLAIGYMTYDQATSERGCTDTLAARIQEKAFSKKPMSNDDLWPAECQSAHAKAKVYQAVVLPNTR